MNCKSSRDVWSNVYGKKSKICKSASSTDRHGLKLLNDDEFVDENKRKEMEYSIKRLHELISDPITQESKPWIDRLLNNFLDGIKSVGYRVKDLPAIMQVLEFLAWKTRDNPDYQKHLDKMLEHCCWPPRFDKSSEILSSRDVIEHYFSLLGYIIVILSNYQDDISKVLNALCQLLTKTKSIDKSAVKLEYRYEAVEKSKLPSIIANFIEICNNEIFDKLLDLIWIIVSISDTCCHKMLEHGIINHLLIKLPQLLVNSETTNNLNSIKKDVDDKGIQIVNILWKLMASIIFSNDIPITVMKNSIPKLEAIESLKSAFKITLDGSQSSKNFTTIRNDLSVIILSGLTVKWSLVASGLADDIITSSISTTTPTTSDDIFYQKTLQCILCHLAHCDASITIMKKKFVVSKILEDLTSKYNSRININSRDLIEGSGLIENSLKTLQNIVPKIPHQFINENGPSKIISILKLSLKSNLNNSVVEEIAKTICSLLIIDDKIMLKKFQDAEIISTLIELTNQIINLKQLTRQNQRLLKFCLMSIELSINNEDFLLKNNGNEFLKIAIKLLERFTLKNSNDFLIDKRLLIALGSFIWKCIVWCPENLKTFVEDGGTYLILDIIEKSNILVQNVYLGILIDMCQGSNCIPHLCTWRGIDKSKGALSLMAKIWREEENTIGTKRTPEGCVKDIEFPLMGIDQWNNTFRSKSTFEFSPALAAIWGSVRPKIYSIRQILISNSEIYDKVREHYKILLDDLPIEDSITYCIIDEYLHLIQGQIWAEVLRYLKQTGVNPLGSDGEMLLIMRQRHRLCGLKIQEKQDKILDDADKKELQLEINEFYKIRETKIPLVLEAINQMDLLRRTIDNNYRRKKKDKLIKVTESSSSQSSFTKSINYKNNNDDFTLVSPPSSASILSNNFSTDEELSYSYYL